MNARTATVVAVLLSWPLLAGAAPRGTVVRAPSTGAEFPGKPTGPIAVDYRLAAEPAVGVPLTISVTASVDGVSMGLAIDAHGTEPRAVLVVPPTLVAAADGVYSWQITVVPLAVEAGYLSVVVSGTVDDTAQARSVTIPLRSAAAAPRDAATVERPDGETLIALPAEESSH